MHSDCRIARKRVPLYVAFFLSAVLHSAVVPAAERAAHYPEALALANKTGKDIVVFQRGSDWNPLGEMLYRNVWAKEEFVDELGGGFVLVAVDRPESAAGKAASRLAKAADAESPLPPNEIVVVESQAKVPFVARKDGTFLGAIEPNPDRDILTLRLRVKGGGRILRLDFPPDSSLPTSGPGRAPNGNFCISEIVVVTSAKPLAITAAWANSGRPEQGAWKAIDGLADQADNFWNSLASGGAQRTLFLVMETPLRRGENLSVELRCLSNSKQHVPGCMRAASLDDAEMAADVLACAEAERTAAFNAAFSWWDTTICPRIALLDSDGRAVACENKPRLGLTATTMAARVKELRAIREKRDALWAKADAAHGPARAELLRQGLDVMGFANWPGNDGCYVPVHDSIRAADPKDESGAVRWLGFGRDPRDGLKWAEPSWLQALAKKNPTDQDFAEALARIDRELKDPRNKVLDLERIQRIMIAKYLVYSRWPKNKERRFGVQRDIAALDPDTFWGIGAIGDLGMHHRTETPMLTYGWAASQVKPGANIWDMADTAYLFDHAGSYTVRLNAKGGKGALTIRRIAILDGTRVLSEARPDVRLGQGNASVEAEVNVKEWHADRRLVLRVEADAREGQTDVTGEFVVEPQLPAVPAGTTTATGADDLTRLLIRCEIPELQRKLDAILSAAATNESGVSDSPDVQAALAQATVIRLCGAEKLGAIARRDGGAMFLDSLFKDVDWLESLLASGKADWPQSLENLYLLKRYSEGWEQPFNQRLATALALQWGKRSPYRLVDRFAHVQRALREGLMHASFESLDVRELRWAVYLDGTARDYQFLLDDRQVRLRDYLGAHSGIRYVSFNAYGVSVQDGWNYLAPWAHVYGGRFIIHKQVGGVCGAVSSYAAGAARAHGIPSIDIGQPGHCAFIVRSGQEWPVGNSVAWPSMVTAPGWDGTSYTTMNRLYEPVHQDRERFLKASRLSWLAQWQADRDRSHADWTKTYQQAIAAQPTNYGTWLEYIKLLETAQTSSATTWLDLGKRAARTFSAYNEAGWALARRCLDKALPAMKPSARMDALLACNRELRQDNWHRPDGFPYQGILDWQLKSLGNPALEVELFGKLLAIHHSENPRNNFIFGAVMNWGAKRFSGNPATAPAYAKAMAAFFRAKGESLDSELLAATLKNSIRKTSEAGDIISYRLWTDMAENMLPPLKPNDVHLTPAHVAARPKHEPFPGLLLSRDAMLQTSSAHPDDRPLSYAQILAGGSLAWFDTASDARPWAQVVLPGEAELSGVILVGRYEYPPNDASYKSAPLKVSVSVDGKTWTEVACFEKDEMVFRVDLQGQNLPARYVRAERVPGPQETKPFERFNLRGFMVYGKKLY